jgi:very-short-patch-repair endonuclease
MSNRLPLAREAGEGGARAPEPREGAGEGEGRHGWIGFMPNRQARALRLTMTDAERRLWACLRGRRLVGYKFRRQHPLGRFVVDFACIEHRLVIEADGGQHCESWANERRTVWLERRGWRVLRFWNLDILAHTEGVQEMILEALSQTR